MSELSKTKKSLEGFLNDPESNTENMMYQKAQQMFAGREMEMDDTFQFECGECGRCCHGHDDINLTGHDIYRIAIKLRMPMAAVVDKFAHMYVGCDSKMPVAMMKQRFDDSCPLLSLGRCVVHDHKPVTCAIFPMGRMISNEDRQIRYFLQESDPNGLCKRGSTTYTLRSWLEKFNLTTCDEDTFAWYDALFALNDIEIVKWYKENYDSLQPKTQQIIWQVIAMMLYIDYDIDKPYAEQVYANISKFKVTMEEMWDFLQGIGPTPKGVLE
jgi:hypothetical protein